MLRSEPDEKGRMHEGFMIDLLDLIAEKLKFDYVVYEVADRKYGAEVEPGKWNGMVGELMHRDSSKVRSSLFYSLNENVSLYSKLVVYCKFL